MGWAEFAMGLVGGAAQGGLDDLIEKEKARIQRDRDVLLSNLRKEEYQHQLDAKEASDAKYADSRRARKVADQKAEDRGKAESAVENQPMLTDAEIKKKQAMAPVDLEIDAAKERQKKGIAGEFMEQDAKAEGMKAGARKAAEAPYEEAKLQEAARLARIAQQDKDSRELYIDEQGNYRRKSDNAIQTDKIYEGGRLLGETPIKAPKSKVSGSRDQYWVEKENLDSANRALESAQKKLADLPTPENRKAVEEAEKLVARREREAREARGESSPAPAAKPQAQSKGGLTFTGKYTKDGKKIMQDANGNKFVE